MRKRCRSMVDARLVRARAWLGLWALVLCAACARPYQVGDHVLVEWGDEGHVYPGFIVKQKSASVFRVHFEGYPARWDEDVSLPRIRGRADESSAHPPPPRKIRLAQARAEGQEDQGQLGRYKPGDRVKVSWRGSVYRAVVLELKSPTEFKIHYEGHEAAWDEVVPAARIVTTP